MRVEDTPPAAWELFDECPICYAGPKMPCYALTSRSKNLLENSLPHPKRKRLLYIPRNEISDRFYPR